MAPQWTRTLIGCLCLASLPGCALPTSRAPSSEPSAAARPLSADDLLTRCIAAYGQARTLEFAGVLEHQAGHLVARQNVYAVLDRPDRCRLEVDGNVTVLIGRDAWTYDARSDRFGRYRAFTDTPMQTAAEMACNRVPLLSIDLFLRGARALRTTTATDSPWTLGDVGFVARRPCYELVRAADTSGRGRLRLWIDQDHHVLRRWRIERGPLDEPEVIACMDYTRVGLDAPPPTDAFVVSRPRFAMLPK